jgi:predicted GIY-YIG superfamily endonuclease
MTPGCYLFHFEPSYKHAAHYLGWSPEVQARIHAHLCGRGARLTKVARAAGSTLLLVRTWPDGDRALERRLKNWHGSAPLCPICRGEAVQMPLMPWMPAYVPEPEVGQEDQPDDTRDDQPEYTERFEDLAMTDDYADDIEDRAFFARGQW